VARPARRGRPLVSVTLRPAMPRDAAWLDAWLPAVLASVGHDAFDVRTWLPASRSGRGRIIVRDGADVGLLAYRVNAPHRGDARFEIVATLPALARRGSGMAAAALAEQELRAADVRTVYAPAPAIHGIDVYFWLRLGYRPLLRGDWPCERAGVAWLAREI